MVEFERNLFTLPVLVGIKILSSDPVIDRWATVTDPAIRLDSTRKTSSILILFTWVKMDPLNIKVDLKGFRGVIQILL